MPDQPSPPPKPKPGSLRDRIAAFEKSASAAAPPAPAPAVRPKPAGFSSWKPKVPSPPSSPPASTTEHAASTSTRVGGMSASDAKESITKAGSLRERMAALQGKGAFGAPPTVAPKPALEKPKWKPPPVVHAPVDDDDHAAEASTAGIAAAVERTISPPVSVQSQENVEPLKVLAEGEESAAPAAAAEGDNEGEAAAVDPEEEERQRRAAIAARMARLGGARLGMAPPVFGKKPPVRRSTQEEIPPAEEPKVTEEQPKHEVSSPEPPKSVEIASPPPAEEALVASPPTGAVAEDVRKAPEYFPSRKNSENASVLSSESTGSQPAKSPSSMPVPVVPRRAGPPRKKPVKPAAPPPEVPEEQAEETTPAPVTAEEAEKPVEEPVREPEPAIPRHEVAESPEHEESKAEIREEAPQPPVIPALPEVHHEVTPEPVAEVAEISGKEDLESATPSQVKSVESPGEETPVPPETSGFISPPPSLAQTNEDDLDDEYDDEDDEDSKMAESFIAPSIPPPPRAAPAEIAKPEETHVQSEISAPAPDVEEEDTEAAEEEARKKRVAERLAKMGGINPFAPPPQVKPSSEFAHSPPPAPAAFAASPPLAPTVVYEERHPVVTHSPLHEEAPPVHKEPFTESKVEEEELSDEGEDELSDYEPEPPAASEEHEKPKAPTLPRSESQHEQVDYTSRPPPVPPSGTRPPAQVEQFEGGSDDEYEDESGRETFVSSKSINPPVHPPPPTWAPPRAPPQHPAASSPPVRPAQPPRRIIPQAPEDNEEEEEEEEAEEATDEEADERLAQSHLFVPPPPGQRGPGGIPPPRRQYLQEDEDGDGSENDTPALPHLQRRSMEVPPVRSAPSPPSDYGSEPDSDHDGQALPIPPRNPAGHPPPRVVPPPPPLPPQVSEQEAVHHSHSPPVRRTLPPAPTVQQDAEVLPTSPSLLTPGVSFPGSSVEEILDEEEGDPIDPSFHSPSRRTSSANLQAVAQSQSDAPGINPSPPPPPAVSSPPPPPPPFAAAPQTSEEREEQPERDIEQLRRKTIAERMAKLGGIKFGAAPIPTPATRPPPPHPSDEQEEDASGLVAEEQPAEVLSEEEEERARKERISAKLAHMGGMRIGMMPVGMGMGGAPPQRSHVLREEREESVPESPPPPPPPSAPRAVPPSRPPPPPTHLPPPPQRADTDSDYGSAAASSEDGVKVEPEESELEEVDFEDAEEPEEAPPPVPSRSARAPHRQESADKPTSPPPPSSRPPVPSMPIRRSSVQTTRSMTSSSAGDTIQDARKSSSFMHPSHSEYVMVEEPESQEAPPPPPARRTSRLLPARATPQLPPTPSMARKSTDPSESISSQWELPSIPTSAFDFGGGGDLSLSWTDAAEAGSPPGPSQPPPPPSKKASLPPSELHLSADDLMALWGRVGVQVCEVATTMFEKSKKTLIGDGTYAGFVQGVLATVPNAAPVPTASGEYGYLVYVQNGPSVQKRASEIMPGDIVEIHDAKLKGHKGIQTYHQNVGGAGEVLVGIVGEFEAKKTKIRVFHANQHVGQQTVESVSYRLEDLKSGTVKVYRALEG